MKNVGLVLLGGCFILLGCKENQNMERSRTVPDTAVSKLDVAQEIKIKPILHATAVLEWKTITVYVDPVGGAKAFEMENDPDLILITDNHSDHFSVETLQQLDTRKAKIMVPQTVADKIPAEFTPQIDVLDNGDAKERYHILVEAIPMCNFRDKGRKFHSKGTGNGYVLNMGGKRLYISGATEDVPEMRSLKNIDKALVSMNVPYSMTVESAADAVLKMAPKQVYPYHYRGDPDVSDVIKFKELVNRGNPKIEVVQLDWYPQDDF